VHVHHSTERRRLDGTALLFGDQSESEIKMNKKKMKEMLRSSSKMFRSEAAERTNTEIESES